MKKELINKMDEYILSSLKDGDSSAIDSFLESNGFELADINDLADKSYKQISFKIKGQLASQKDELLLDKATQFFQDAINRNLEKPVNYLKSLISSNQFALHYRNLDKLTPEEIKEIIKDHNLLEVLEKFQEDEESEG